MKTHKRIDSISQVWEDIRIRKYEDWRLDVWNCRVFEGRLRFIDVINVAATKPEVADASKVHCVN
jgi:hypothetical protein